MEPSLSRPEPEVSPPGRLVLHTAAPRPTLVAALEAAGWPVAWHPTPAVLHQTMADVVILADLPPASARRLAGLLGAAPTPVLVLDTDGADASLPAGVVTLPADTPPAGVVAAVRTLLQLRSTSAYRPPQPPELREMADALHRSQERLRLALQAPDLYVWTWDLQRNTFHVLHGADEHGAASEMSWAPTPTSLLDLVIAEDRAPLLRRVREAAQQGGYFKTECRVYHDDGSLRWAAVQGNVRVGEDGEIAYLSGLALDVTHRKEAERALRRQRAELRSLNTTLEHRVAERTATLQQRNAQARALAVAFTRAEQREHGRLSQVLHDDIQQLLCGIKLPARVLRNKLDDRTLLPLLDDIVEIADEAIHITRTLTADLSPPVLDDDGLDTALAWLAQHMQERHDLRVHLHADAPCPMPSDDLRLLLFQLVRELLRNVVKHADVDAVTVRLVRSAERVCIEVSDEGRGFDLEAAETEKGYGLRSIRHRIDLFGGRFHAASTPGEGARFTIDVPVTPDASGD